MYAEYFGLKQAPFSIAPDPHYLFMSERHREALAHLLYGLGGGGGFVLLTGEIGAGKTTVCRCFLEQIPKRCNVAYIFNPKLTVVELMRSVCDEFLVPYPNRRPGTATVTDYLDPLNAFLLRTHGVGQNNVLIIDEAQNLSPDVLEQLRLMTNLETHERKLLQIILIGQPELRDMVAQPGLQQLAQRVIARFHLEALSEDETAQYIRHRLAVAGMTGPIPFPADSLKRIHRLCRGVPRRINLLCDRALLGAYAGGKVVVDRHIIDKAAREVFDASEVNALMGAAAKRSPLLMTLVLGMALGAVAWAGGNWLVGRSRANAAPVEVAAGASAPAVASAAASAASASASAAESASASASATAPPPSASAAASAATRRPEAH
jgi:general secretion pathway protein A